MKRAIIIFFISISFITANAQDVYKFLNVPVSPHANALGRNNVSIPDADPLLIFQNPALLSPEMNMKLNMSYMSYIKDIAYGGAVFSKSINDLSACAIGVNYLNHGEFKGINSQGEYFGNFSAKEMSLNASYSRYLANRWRGGVTLKYIYSSLYEYSSSAIAVDLGLNYNNPDANLHIGIAATNIGAQISSYNTTRNSLPWDISVGVTKGLKKAPFRFSITATNFSKRQYYAKIEKKEQDVAINSSNEKEKEEKTFDPSKINPLNHLIFGIDFIPTKLLWIGVGYNTRIARDMQLNSGNYLAGFSAGAGINTSIVGFGVSVAQLHPSVTSLHFNININISKFY